MSNTTHFTKEPTNLNDSKIINIKRNQRFIRLRLSSKFFTLKQKMAVTTGCDYKYNKCNHRDTALLWLCRKKQSHTVKEHKVTEQSLRMWLYTCCLA